MLHDTNADLVRELRVPPNADDEAIQEALLRLFNAQVQVQSVSDSDEGQAVRAKRSDQALKASESDSDRFQSSSDPVKSELSKSDTVQAVQDQDQISVPVSSNISAVDQCKLSVYRSSIEIDNSLRVKINSLLKNEILYRDILDEMESTERNEIKRGQEKFKVQKNLLLIHIAGQPEDLQYWRVVVPDDVGVKTQLVSELHSVPYSAHPGVQRTLGKVRRYFYWKGMAGDICEFVESCPTCQLEKSDHTLQKGSL